MFRPGCRWIAAAGFPIRKSSDRHLYTASRGLSQCPTSFIGVWRQGIHRVPLVTCSRDAEKSNFFSLFVLLVDALSIQLVRCCLRLPVWAAAGWRSLLSVPPGDLPFTQHSPAHCRAALPILSVPIRAVELLDIFSQSHQPFACIAQVEMRGFEPLASALQRQRSPN